MCATFEQFNRMPLRLVAAGQQPGDRAPATRAREGSELAILRYQWLINAPFLGFDALHRQGR
jgi:hypothetical protein